MSTLRRWIEQILADIAAQGLWSWFKGSLIVTGLLVVWEWVKGRSPLEIVLLSLLILIFLVGFFELLAKWKSRKRKSVETETFSAINATEDVSPGNTDEISTESEAPKEGNVIGNVRPTLPQTPWRDWNMKQALEWWETAHHADAANEGLEFFHKVRQGALDRHITVWGRRNMQMRGYKDYGFEPLVEIPSEHWKDHDFGAIRYIFGDDEATIREASSPPGGDIVETRYYDLMVASSEVQALWPAENI